MNQPAHGFPRMNTIEVATQMKVRYVQMGKGHLKVYTRTVDGVVVMEAFTLQSLADCLGWAQGTIEGKYHRKRLFVWKVDIPTGQSRPVRGFPLAMLDKVLAILTQHGARIESDPNAERVVGRQAQGSARFPLVYERHGKEQYITIPALAEHFGRSTTTIRNKLAKAGLLAKGINLNHGTTKGGRPRRGYPVSMQDQLIDAIENGAQFFNECQTVYNRVMAANQMTESPAASRERVEWIPPQHKPAPAQADKPQDDVAQFVAGIEAIMAGAGGARPEPPSHDPLAAINALGAEQIQLPAGNPDLRALADRIIDIGIWNEDQVEGEIRAAKLTPQQRSEVMRLAGVQGA